MVMARVPPQLTVGVRQTEVSTARGWGLVKCDPSLEKRQGFLRVNPSYEGHELAVAPR